MTEKDEITMSQMELSRLHAIHQVLDGKIKQVEAAEKLGLSDRQIRRIIRAVRAEGDKAIAHGLRGKPSHRRIDQAVKNRVLNLYEKKYPDFGPTFAAEKLEELDGIKLSDETLRLWLIEKGLWEKRKSRKHRHWRKRSSCFGAMVQFDGSHHDWFEGRGPKCVLMNFIDDATNQRFARFFEYEGVMPAMEILKLYIQKNGIPQSIYLDRHATYKSQAKQTIEDELENKQAISQFERAAAELGIRIIHANSPQAKGRVERDFKTQQNRLVKEMRLEGINDIDGGNKYLPRYLMKHNRRFREEAENPTDMHRAVPEGLDLDSILCVKTVRTLKNDFTVQYDTKFFQVLNNVAGKKVICEEDLRGRFRITYNGKELAYKEIERPTARSKKPRIRYGSKAHKPPMSHPYKSRMFNERVARDTARAEIKAMNLKQAPELALKS